MPQAFIEADQPDEPCIAFDPDPDGELCPSRAEPGSPYCTEHQVLDIDPESVGLLPVFGPIAPPVRRPSVPAEQRHQLIRAGLCPCDPTTGQSCRLCDGTDAEEREFWSASRAQRSEYLRGMREWRADFDAQTQPEGIVA